MDWENKTIGFAMCGSFCTFKKAMGVLEKLTQTGANVIPIMSEMSYNTDTRFGKAEDFRTNITNLTGNNIICCVKDAEPIGPKNLLDLLVVLPCTGNTLAKIANGIADTKATKGSETISIKGGSASETLVAGDIFKVGNQQYVVTEDAIADTGVVTAKVYPAVVEEIAAETEITFIDKTAGGHVANLVFNKNAFAFVTRPLELPSKLPKPLAHSTFTPS